MHRSTRHITRASIPIRGPDGNLPCATWPVADECTATRAWRHTRVPWCRWQHCPIAVPASSCPHGSIYRSLIRTAHTAGLLNARTLVMPSNSCDDASVLLSAVADPDPALRYERAIIEASPNALVMKSDPLARSRMSTRTTIEITGRPRNQLVGKEFSDFFTEPERAPQSPGDWRSPMAPLPTIL